MDKKKIFFYKGLERKPRVTVTRSLKHISVQAIDDIHHKTLCSVSSTQKEVRKNLKGKTGNKQASAYIGKLMGEKLKEKKYEKIIFDRNGMIYHGNIKVLADAIRETGIQF